MLSLTSIFRALQSARIILWVPILVNASLISYFLTFSYVESLLLSLSLCCVSAYGFLINDLKDIEVDRENRAGRLENASLNVVKTAKYLAFVFAVSAIGLCLLLDLRAVVAMGCILLGLMLYTYVARPRLVIATLLAAILGGSPLWLPNLVFAVQPSASQWIIIFLATIFLLGREIIFDAQDFRGDLREKRRTFATVFSRKFAINLSLALNCLGTFLLLILVIAKQNPLSFAGLHIFAAILFVALMLPPVIGLKTFHELPEHFKAFTQRSRLAMLLLPVFWWIF